MAIGAGILLTAGLGMGYLASNAGADSVRCDTGSTSCDRVAVLSSKIGTAVSAVAGNKNACQAVALTFSAEAGAPAVTSNTFPAGTKLRITNLDNNKSTTVPVTGVSGSCALLNTAAMDQIRQPGKNVIRRNTVEVIQASTPATPATNPPAGGGACNGVALTFSAEVGAPAVTSNTFPAGTKLRITNLDNNKSTTVPVTGVSGSCALLNTAAMDQIRQPGKNVIRRNTVERVK